MKDEGRVRAMARCKHKRMHASKLESERDSGFSDGGSEHLSAVDQTDTDDASRSSFGSSQLMPVVGGALSPMIFMNNVVLKQSVENPSSSKPWAFSPVVEVVPQPQVVFLQPVVPQRSAPVPKGPPPKRRRHRKYLPILKSYPKIAPHPPSSSVKSSSSSDAHEAAERRPESTASNACSDDTDNKITRFCNTYNVLSNSGLLDITLRTKELIRQNRRTQTELDRLRQHTNLFVEALQTGDSGIWSRLQTSVQEEDVTPSDGESLE